MARKLKLIPKGAENSKGYDFEIKFNPEAGANCLVKYRAQVYVSNHEYFRGFQIIWYDWGNGQIGSQPGGEFTHCCFQ